MYFLFFFFFFFQAEDGIRDLTVTGVQTCALPIYIKLLDLDGAVVEGGADHHRVCGSIAPGEPTDLSPHGCGRIPQIVHFAAESELAGMERTTRAIGPSERVRHLGQRNSGSIARNVPGSFILAVVARHPGADLAAEGIDVYLHPDAAFADARQINCDCVKVEAGHQAE